jgi:hypothetical protein
MTPRRTTSTSIVRPDPVVLADDIGDTLLGVFCLALVCLSLAFFLTVAVGGVCSLVKELPDPGPCPIHRDPV